MDRAQAEVEAGRLNAEHPERDRFEWVALARGGDGWAVVRTPRREHVDPLKTTTLAAPRPPQPEDPSFGPLGDLPGYR